jgi:hypothetical protein
MKFELEHMFDKEVLPVVHMERFANKTYAAEWHCFGRSVMGQYHPSMPITLTEAKQIAYSLGIHDVTIVNKVRSDKRSSTYYYDSKTIQLNPRHGVYVLLHELAHHVCGEKGHSRKFRGHYLRLVRLELGDEWSDRLARAFKTMGLSWEMYPEIPTVRKAFH